MLSLKKMFLHSGKRKAIKGREERFQATGPEQVRSIDFLARGPTTGTGDASVH